MANLQNNSIPTEIDIEVTETVDKTPENVTETTETVSVASEVDNMPVVIEPKALALEQNFSWNFEDMKVNLQAHIKRYAGLVVTDRNLKPMEKTQKEVASLRTKISKFRLAVKHDMEKPYKAFEQQVNQLLDLVQSVEKPLKDQLEVYENKRREAKSQDVWDIIHQTATELGLEEKYLSQMAIDEKWLNRIATKAQITEDIQMRLCWLLDMQAKDHQAEVFAEQKVEMAKLLCQSLSTGLVTPLTYEEIEKQISSMQDILTVKSFIEAEVDKRKQREERAAQLAVEQAIPVASMPSPPMPQSAPKTTWDVVLRLPGINMQQSVGFQKYLADSGIRYEVVSSQQASSSGDTL